MATSLHDQTAVSVVYRFLPSPRRPRALSECNFEYRRLHYLSRLQALCHWLKSNVWLITCKICILARPPASFSFYRLSHSEMATPPPKGPCRLFRSKEGCRYGKKCKFSHDLGSTSGTRTQPQPPGAERVIFIYPCHTQNPVGKER
jgi:hypothetical protein